MSAALLVVPSNFADSVCEISLIDFQKITILQTVSGEFKGLPCTELLDRYHKGVDIKPEDMLRDPYLLEFLGLENQSYPETDLEKAIIDHLQTFLLEMGMGFCFEARQRRITFDNTHYHIDLVFYHRVLKCHVLVELKMEAFSHADAGQMNVYLNYYKENEMQKGDNPPIGIILCAGKSEALLYPTI